MGKKNEVKYSTVYVTITNDKMMKIVEQAKAEGITSRAMAEKLLSGAVK